MEEEKRVWAIDCTVCRTTVDLPINDFKIISTDNCAEFLKMPVVICGKCQSTCEVRLTTRK